jgi:hypothetical protein
LNIKGYVFHNLCQQKCFLVFCSTHINIFSIIASYHQFASVQQWGIRRRFKSERKRSGIRKFCVPAAIMPSCAFSGIIFSGAAGNIPRQPPNPALNQTRNSGRALFICHSLSPAVAVRLALR